MEPKVLLFDLFGTLFDVAGTTVACERSFPGHGERLGQLWREKQLRYTWLRTLMGRYEDFERVTKDALVAACRELHLGLDEPLLSRLSSAFLRLQPFPEVARALTELQSFGYRLGVLSNGTRQQLNAVLAQSTLDLPLAVFTADDVRLYKPDPRVYAHGVQQATAAVHEVLFVSSNAWDVAGARAFGLSCAWLRRSDAAFEELDVAPTMVVRDLDDLVSQLQPGASPDRGAGEP